jgi:hypothetical protein
VSVDEIAKELTIAMIDRIRAIDETSRETLNKSLADEVSKAYTTIHKAVLTAYNSK